MAAAKLFDENLDIWGLNHLCRVDFFLPQLWMGPFPKKGCLISFYYYQVL